MSREKTRPTTKITGSHSPIYTVEKDFIELFDFMQKAVVCLQRGLEYKENDLASYTHYLRVAFAYMRKAAPLLNQHSWADYGRVISDIDMRALLSIRNLIRGLKPGDPDTFETPYLILLKNLVKHKNLLGDECEDKLFPCINSYAMLLQNYDFFILNLTYTGSISNQCRYALPEAYIRAVYALLEQFEESRRCARVPYTASPKRHPFPGVLRIEGKDITVEAIGVE